MDSAAHSPMDVCVRLFVYRTEKMHIMCAIKLTGRIHTTLLALCV